LLLADAKNLVGVKPESFEKRIRNVDQLNSQRQTDGLVKRQLQLVTGALLPKIGVALDAMNANLSCRLSAVFPRHWMRIIAVVILAFLDR
jgi:hypothetical protein